MEECIICGTNLYIGYGVCFDCKLKEKEERNAAPEEIKMLEKCPSCGREDRLWNSCWFDFKVCTICIEDAELKEDTGFANGIKRMIGSRLGKPKSKHVARKRNKIWTTAR